jgi:molybdate transport system substrate-binding protein
VKPDVYLGERAASEDSCSRAGSPRRLSPSNDLAIMVRAGNPAHVAGLADLARTGLALAMPNPAFEGVARQIRATLVKAGGEALAEAVYGRKARNGEAVLTRIHHRHSPLLLVQGLVDAGATWKSEALFQEEIGNPISHVDIPEAQNTRAEYSATMVKDAPHPEAARAWLDFIASETAFAVAFSRATASAAMGQVRSRRLSGGNGSVRSKHFFRCVLSLPAPQQIGQALTRY